MDLASEKELDKALHEALETNEAFRTWFVGNLFHGESFDKLVLCRSDHPWTKFRVILPDTETGALNGVDREGETDVLAVFQNSSGKRLGVHIENKLATGSFTPYQPDLYAARADHWIGNESYGCYDLWETMLLAPESFMVRNETEAKKFTSRMTHEQVSEFIPEFGTT